MVGVYFYLNWRTLRFFPESLVRYMFGVLAYLIWRFNTRGVKTLKYNLAIALPGYSDTKIKRLSKMAVKSYLQYWSEVFVSLYWPKSRIKTHTTYGDKLREKFQTIKADNKGALVALPHMGNIDLAGAYVKSQGWKVNVVVERLRSGLMYREFLRYRKRLGLNAYPHNLGYKLVPTLSKKIKDGEMVCLLADRVLSGVGEIDVDFFGVKSKFPAGPALLCIRNKVPLIPIFVVKNGKHGWIVDTDENSEIYAPKSGTLKEKVSVVTQQLAKRFELYIRRYPESWHMWQPVAAK